MKIKSIIFSVLALTIFFYSCDKLSTENNEYRITTRKAKEVALKFSNSQMFDSKLTKASSLYSVDSIYSINDSAIFVVELLPSGYVLVSGSLRTYPIIGHSNSDIFSLHQGSPLHEWIDSVSAEILQINSISGYQIDTNTRNFWLALAPSIDDEIIVEEPTVYEQSGPFCDYRWGQGCGFNDYMSSCPTSQNCGHALVGCANVAMGILMKYNQKPSQNNWNAMPANYGAATTASLLHDIAVNTYTIQGCKESNTYPNDAFNALKYYYGYSNINNVSFTENIARNELQSSRPMFIFGYSSVGGHGWVCDGFSRYVYTLTHNPGTIYEYQTTSYSPTYYHMNWGWNGSSNGWYTYSLTSGFSGFTSLGLFVNIQ